MSFSVDVQRSRDDSSVGRKLSLHERELYDRLVKAVHRACPGWLLPRVDDLAQKAALRVLERAQRESGESGFCASYLYRVATSVVIDEIRTLRRRPTESLESQDDTFVPDSTVQQEHENPESEASRRRLGEQIRDCLTRMKSERRLAMTMNLQGYSVPEAAKVLGWDKKRTENLTVRGRSDLRRCLEAKGVAR